MAKQIVHLSDGKKIVCGAKSGKSTTDVKNYNCKKCKKAVIALAEKLKKEKAEKQTDQTAKQEKKKTDTSVWCRIFNRNLVDGTDFQFTFEGKLYHLVSGGIRRIPRSVIIHLRGLHYPTPKYKQGETGGTVKIEGSRHCYIVNELSEEEVKEVQAKESQAKDPAQKTG